MIIEKSVSVGKNPDTVFNFLKETKNHEEHRQRKFSTAKDHLKPYLGNLDVR
jgi:hypothetical protein